MTIENKFNAALKHATESAFELSYQQLTSLIDYTCLNTGATHSDIQTLAIKASEHRVAAVCVYSQHLNMIPEGLPLVRATVVNFPRGDSPLPEVLDSIDQISRDYHVNEIDYVFPYQTYQACDYTRAISHCHSAYTRCQEHGLVFKVILETGAFSSLEMIYQLSLEIIDSGCDFLKTSTGKISQGASIPAAFAMLLAIQTRHSSCGLKLSGGIRSAEQAMAYVKLAHSMLHKEPENSWLRFGTSSLLDTGALP